jgi:hypothetical protein
MRTDTPKIFEIDSEMEGLLEPEMEEITNINDFTILAEKKGIEVNFAKAKHHGVLARQNGHAVMLIDSKLTEEQQTLVGFHLYCRYLLNIEEIFAMNLPDNYILLKLFIDLHEGKNRKVR